MRTIYLACIMLIVLSSNASYSLPTNTAKQESVSDIFKFEGKYVLSVGAPIKIFEIIIKNGRVVANIPGVGSIPLKYKSQNVYIIEGDYDATITFIWTGDSVNKAVVDFDGHEVEALRLEE
jgi:hypothetical protein